MQVNIHNPGERLKLIEVCMQVNIGSQTLVLKHHFQILNDSIRILSIEPFSKVDSMHDNIKHVTTFEYSITIFWLAYHYQEAHQGVGVSKTASYSSHLRKIHRFLSYLRKYFAFNFSFLRAKRRLKTVFDWLALIFDAWLIRQCRDWLLQSTID